MYVHADLTAAMQTCTFLSAVLSKGKHYSREIYSFCFQPGSVCAIVNNSLDNYGSLSTVYAHAWVICLGAA
jgi:hypothetical protein